MENKKKEPMGFAKTMWASTLGVVIAFAIINILGFFLILGLFVAAVSSGSNQKVPLAGNNIWVRIDLSGDIPEYQANEVFSYLNGDHATSFDQILTAVANAATDSKVDGILLQGSGSSSLSWAQSDELRDALAEFKNSGKRLIAYGDAFSQPEYFAATTADLVAVHPSGLVDLKGLGAEVMFYKDLFDKLDVHVELIRPKSNAYKSAGETYTMNHISEANREQVRAYMSSIWGHVADGIAQSRHLSSERVNQIANSLSGYMAHDALASGIVDSLMFADDVQKLIKDNYNAKKIVSVERYMQSISEKNHNDKIAIIYAEGDVVQGSNQGFQTSVFSDDIVESFNKAADDDNVKAIVLRVNSPGGDVIASESMTHAIIRAKEKKPVVVSMSGLAASAGYEISCNAHTIVAEPTTITGSIGVFAMVPQIGTMLKNKLGLTTDTVKTNENATGLSVMRPLSPTAYAMMQNHIEDFYVTFCQRVATGRNLKREYVESIAQGRVWTGLDAKQIGLVDTLGGISLALRIAAEKAGIDNYSTVIYPKEKSFLELLKNSGSRPDEVVLKLRSKKQNRADRQLFNDLYYLSQATSFQARIPFIVLE